MAPVPQEELPILEALINIRNRLTALKKDRGEFIKASDVNQLHQAVVKQITKLNDLRDDTTAYNNRVDTTLADVFSLLSLFYLTIGKTRDAPATYCQIASMRQILNHMNESAVYNEADLKPFQRRLTDLRTIIQQDGENAKNPKPLTKLLERQLNECDAIVQQLQDSLSVLSPELVPVHQKLVTIRRQLVALAAKEGSQKAELKPIIEELRRIDSTRVDGKFLGPGGIVPSSQAICSSLLEECFEIIQEIKAHEDSKNVASSLKPIYDRLSEIRAELESLTMTHRWSLRETDLWNYSLSLQEIDKMRVDGKFVDADGNRPPGQYVLLYLLRRCYGLIYRLLSSSEPVSEELMPIANKLTTVKKCLNEVLKYGGPFNPRDLYPYQLALFQIDSMRKDGRFVGMDGSIPEGQGIINANLSECHELVEMLKESMDEGETEEDEDDYDYDYSDSGSDLEGEERQQ
ncbi:CUB1 family protein C30C2.08 [Psilocybe cubensis]|uniref:CUB1 family protein C30C2.08 n=2 Tax=Psilocybe cubensis TaxID=181762 RepID=A0ACB8GVA3_PSICU|nr:CUB1 family protein C30C2.08 [Psilocybe cubensis]KAH9479506.1 CUB1 family protein C30C2.08 [Psilocybe cubensis]